MSVEQDVPQEVQEELDAPEFPDWEALDAALEGGTAEKVGEEEAVQEEPADPVKEDNSDLLDSLARQGLATALLRDLSREQLEGIAASLPKPQQPETQPEQPKPLVDLEEALAGLKEYDPDLAEHLRPAFDRVVSAYENKIKELSGEVAPLRQQSLEARQEAEAAWLDSKTKDFRDLFGESGIRAALDEGGQHAKNYRTLIETYNSLEPLGWGRDETLRRALSAAFPEVVSREAPKARTATPPKVRNLTPEQQAVEIIRQKQREYRMQISEAEEDNLPE